MTTSINSLASFRRFLATPGATIQLIRHDGHANDPKHWEKHKDFWAERTVAKLQTNAVKFSNDSWLYWDREGAKMFRFDNTDIVTINFARHPDDEPFSKIFQYRCWIPNYPLKFGQEKAA
jgi:hypothetical protein